jgi:hypothetical protein
MGRVGVWYMGLISPVKGVAGFRPINGCKCRADAVARGGFPTTNEFQITSANM